MPERGVERSAASFELLAPDHRVIAHPVVARLVALFVEGHQDLDLSPRVRAEAVVLVSALPRRGQVPCRGMIADFDLIRRLLDLGVLSDGTGTPEDYFAYARDVAALDVIALTDHDHWGQ